MNPIVDQAVVAVRQVESAMQRLAFAQALDTIMQLVSKTNAYVEAEAPWKLAKQSEQARRLQSVLCVLAEVVRIVAILLEPFMPSVSGAIWQQLGCGERPRRLADVAQWGGLPAGQRIGEHPVLFPKPETRVAA